MKLLAVYVTVILFLMNHGALVVNCDAINSSNCTLTSSMTSSGAVNLYDTEQCKGEYVNISDMSNIVLSVMVTPHVLK